MRQYIEYAVICIKIIHKHMSVYAENIFGRILGRGFASGVPGDRDRRTCSLCLFVPFK